MSEETMKQEAPVVDGINKLADANFNALVKLVGIHVEAYLNDLTSNRIAQKDKLIGGKNLAVALKASLNFGVCEENFALPKGGFAAREATKIAALLAQAMDARMLKLAQKMSVEETVTPIAVKEEIVENNELTEETKGEEHE